MAKDKTRKTKDIKNKTAKKAATKTSNVKKISIGDRKTTTKAKKPNISNKKILVQTKATKTKTTIKEPKKIEKTKISNHPKKQVVDKTKKTKPPKLKKNLDQIRYQEVDKKVVIDSQKVASQPEKRIKRAYRKSGKKIATSEFISTKFQPSNALKDFVVPTTMFSKNGRRFGDEHRFNNPQKVNNEIKSKSRYLSKTNLNKLRSILLEQRNRLLEGLDNAVNDLQDEMVTVADPNDRASQETDLALELRERDRETKLIRKIDSTLERIDKKDYGYCDACGIEIGMKRLEARPMATLCIDCKELQEFKEKQTVR